MTSEVFYSQFYSKFSSSGRNRRNRKYFNHVGVVGASSGILGEPDWLASGTDQQKVGHNAILGTKPEHEGQAGIARP